MKVDILQEELTKALGIVTRVVATRGQLPVLANVLLEAEAEGLAVVATNLEVGLRIKVGGKVNEPGAITVPARQLSEFVGTMKPGPVELVTHEEKLAVKSGGFQAEFTGIAASEFPVVAKFPSEGVISVKRTIINTAASQVAFAAAADETRPVLTGVKFVIREGKLVMLATDGFRLSRQTVEMEGAGERMNGLIIPSKTIQELAKLVGDGRKEEVGVFVVEGNNQVVFSYDRVELTSRVLEGNFPDVERIIPPEFKVKVEWDTEALLAAVRAAAIFARENNNIIRFKIDGDKFRITATGGQTGESEVEVEAEIEGEGMEIAFNYRYVLDLLTNFKNERIGLQLNGPLAPGVWKGSKDQGFLHVIMPVRL